MRQQSDHHEYDGNECAGKGCTDDGARQLADRAVVKGTVRPIRAGQVQDELPDVLACEVPVALEINGISHAVMMTTPSDLAEFALGFAYTEGLIERRADVYDIEIEPQGHGAAIIVRMTVSSACFAQLKAARRTLLGRTGCGLCGVDSLAYFEQQPAANPNREASRLDIGLLDAVLARFERLQIMRNQTGTTHAAAWVNWQGEVVLLREDVGRHNALDKLIGALLDRDAHPSDGFVLVSSRASYEMVQKTLRWGAGCLVSVSAATAKAVEWAHQHQLQLIGFARPGRAVWYTDVLHQTILKEQR